MRFAQLFEKVITDTAAAVFSFGVSVIGDTGTLVIDLVKAFIPGGS